MPCILTLRRDSIVNIDYDIFFCRHIIDIAIDLCFIIIDGFAAAVVIRDLDLVVFLPFVVIGVGKRIDIDGPIKGVLGIIACRNRHGLPIDTCEIVPFRCTLGEAGKINRERLIYDTFDNDIEFRLVPLIYRSGIFDINFDGVVIERYP